MKSMKELTEQNMKDLELFTVEQALAAAEKAKKMTNSTAETVENDDSNEKTPTKDVKSSEVTAKTVDNGQKSDQLPAGMVKVLIKGKEVVVKDEPFIAEAVEIGYDPNHQGKTKKSAEQFVKDGSYFKKIAEQKRQLETATAELAQAKAVLQKQIDHSIAVEKAANEVKLKNLQDAKKQSILRSDIDAVVKLDNEINEVQQNQSKIETEIKTAIPEKAPDPALVEWISENNDWCNYDTPENKKLAELADATAARLSQEFPKETSRQILDRTRATIALNYPDRFESNEEVIPEVEGNGVGSGNGLNDDLPPEFMKIWQEAHDLGLKLSISDYKKQLELTGALKNER